MTPAEAIAVVREALRCGNNYSMTKQEEEAWFAAPAALALIEQQLERLEKINSDLVDVNTEACEKADAAERDCEEALRRVLDEKARAEAAERERDNAAQINGMVERKLEARIAQLEEALRGIIAEFKSESCDADATQNMAQIARAALASGKEEA